MRISTGLTTLLLLVAVLGFAAPVAALSFNAYWLYRVSGGDERETRSEYQQRYNLGVGPSLDWQPTHALRASANLSYSQAQRDTGDGLEKTERVSPSVRLSLANDIFTSSLAGSASQGRSDGEWGDVGRSWGANLASAWDIPLWPSLSLNYNEQPSSVTSGNELFDRPDRLQKTAGVSVDWDLLLADLSYRYNRTWDEDRLSGNSNDGNNHFGRLETSGRLLADRVNYRFSQQYQRSQQDGVNFGELLLSGSSAAKQMDGESNPDDDSDTGGSDPEFFDYQSPVGGLPLQIAPQNRLHVTFAENTGFAVEIDLVRLVFAEADTRQAPLNWVLYQRDSDLESWQRVGVVTGEFDADDRLEIPVELTTRQILLVAQTAVGVPLTLQSLGAYTLFDAQGTALTETESINNSWLTNAGVGVTLTRTLSLAFSMGLDLQDDESTTRRADQAAAEGSGSERELDRLSLSGQLQWRPLNWLSTALGVNDTQETTTARTSVSDVEAGSERNSRTYSWSLLTRPLDTMSVTFGVTRNESDLIDTSARSNSSGWQYSLSTTAQIYPDLNAALFLSYAERVNEVDADDSISLTESDSYGARLDLDARLTRTLSADMSINYRQTAASRLTDDQQRDSDTEGAGATLNLSYRPSSYLSLRSFYTTQLLGSDQPDSYGVRVNMALLRTDKARVTVNYSFSYSEEATNSVNLNSSWDISRRMSLRSRAGYIMAESDYYSVETALTLRL